MIEIYERDFVMTKHIAQAAGGDEVFDVATVPRVTERAENLDRGWFEQPAFGNEPLTAATIGDASVMTSSPRKRLRPKQFRKLIGLPNCAWALAERPFRTIWFRSSCWELIMATRRACSNYPLCWPQSKRRTATQPSEPVGEEHRAAGFPVPRTNCDHY